MVRGALRRFGSSGFDDERALSLVRRVERVRRAPRVLLPSA